MKILLDMGHCLKGSDTGAIGNGRTEQQCTREIGNKVKSKLESLGHAVINCSCDSASSVRESLNYRCNKANSNGGDIFISIHLNAGGGLGTEIYTYGAKHFTEADNILNNMVALGFKNRGIKDGKKLAVIRGTKMKAMLVECCFIDSNDMQKYNAENIANAIVKGLVGTTTNKTPVQNNRSANLNGKTGICTGNGVRVRSSKTTQGNDNILGHLNKGDKVRLYRLEGDWVHIYYHPHGGYVHKDYIRY